MSGLLLSFERDSDWDQVNDVQARDEAIDFTAKSTCKCRDLQSIQICATMPLDDEASALKVNVRSGATSTTARRRTWT